MLPRFLRSAAALLTLCLLTAACDSSVGPRAPEVTPSNETLRVGIVVLDDGIVLSGRLFGPRNDPLVILTHMRPNDQKAWFPFAQELADEGYAALTFDFRGYGESEGNQDFGTLDDDLRAVIGYMRDQGREQIFLVGASMGGTTALVAASELPVEGVVSISSPSQFEDQDALAAVPGITAPKLFLASDDDTQAYISLQELVEAAVPPVDSETYPGIDHGTNLFLGDNAGAVKARILQFLGQFRD